MIILILIKINAKGLKVVGEVTKAMRFRLRHMKPALNVGAKYMEKKIQRRFKKQAAPDKFGSKRDNVRWAPNKPSTVKAKGHNIVLLGGGKRKGKLRKRTKATARDRELKIKYPGYGQFHMDGHTGGLFPPRPFAYPSYKDLNFIASQVSRYVVHGPSFRKRG